MNNPSPPENVDGRSVDDWLKTLSSEGLDEVATARVAKKLKLDRKRRKPPKVLIVAGLVVAGATAAAAANGVLPRLFSDPEPPPVATKAVRTKRPVPAPDPVVEVPEPDDTKLLQLVLQKAEKGEWSEVVALLDAPIDPDSMLGPELIVVATRARIELKQCDWLTTEIARLSTNKNWSSLQSELQSMFDSECSESTSAK